MGARQEDSGPLEVRRWRRFGHDRLYVNTPDGTRVGWVNLLDGETTVEVEALRAEFEQALAGHPDMPTELAREPVAAEPPSAYEPAATEPSTEEPVVTEPEPWAVRVDYTDLALRQAGQAAREQAVAHREAEPVKTFVGRVLGVRNDERAWRIGAKGEEKVAAQLGRLPAPWQVLHAVPVGSKGADIDHIAIGPGGVFTVNAKHHPDATVWVGGNTFMVNGHRHPYVRNSRHEAQRAGRLLTAAAGFEVAATGVIAVVGAHKGFKVKAQPEGVHVARRKDVAKWLARQESVLTGEQVAAVYHAARKSSTWK